MRPFSSTVWLNSPKNICSIALTHWRLISGYWRIMLPHFIPLFPTNNHILHQIYPIGKPQIALQRFSNRFQTVILKTLRFCGRYLPTVGGGGYNDNR